MPDTTTLWTVLAAALLLLAAAVVSYNRFIHQRTLVAESWSQIDVELTRRFDLVPNLVETVKGYAAHEQAVLTAVTQARAAAQAHAHDTPPVRASYEAGLDAALTTLNAVTEQYPDLKASAQFIALSNELTTTEDRIAAARRFHTGNVRAYNVRVTTFPSNIVAALCGFKRAEFFTASAAARQTPTAAF